MYSGAVASSSFVQPIYSSMIPSFPIAPSGAVYPPIYHNPTGGYITPIPINADELLNTNAIPTSNFCPSAPQFATAFEFCSSQTKNAFWKYQPQQFQGTEPRESSNQVLFFF